MKKNTRHVLFVTMSCLFASQSILAAPESAQSEKGISAVAESSTKPATPQHQHRRGPKDLTLSIADDAHAELWMPDLSRKSVQVHHGKVTFKPTGVDNYHAVVAERTEGELTEVAIRYQYGQGKPSGHSSTELTAVNKSILEIVPEPIPREHYRYHSDQTWDFIVRFRGNPLANHPVSLATAHGSQTEATSNEAGRVSLHIPDDFPNIVAGQRDKRSAEFTVSTRYSEAGHIYQSTLNAAYRVNPQHWHSLSLGVVVLGIGMLAGGFVGGIGLRKNNKGKQS